MPVAVNFPFDADLTDLLLTTLCDIHSLQSFVLSSKFVYNVFNTRRPSVLRAVVTNHLGFATPPAMRLLKVMMNVNSYWRGWLAPLPVAKLPREEKLPSNDPCTTFTMRETRLLAANHGVVQQLESLYSWRYKGPRSSSSQLTPLESEHFQIALYRVWFVCTLYGRPAPAHRVGKSKPKRLSDIQRDLGREQAKFLQSFPPLQTALLLHAWSFLMELASWAVRAEYLPKKYLVWSGPSTTLQAFQGKLTSLDRKVVPALYLSYEQFSEVFNAAKSLKQPDIGILVSTKDCWDRSELLAVRTALPREPMERIEFVALLWAPDELAHIPPIDWSYLRGIVPPSEFFTFLEFPWWNPYIDADVLAEICRSRPYSQLIRDIFGCRSEAYGTWEPGHWLCLACLQKFLRDNLEEFCRSEQVDQ